MLHVSNGEAATKRGFDKIREGVPDSLRPVLEPGLLDLPVTKSIVENEVSDCEQETWTR
jgi:hypothetical protein